VKSFARVIAAAWLLAFAGCTAPTSVPDTLAFQPPSPVPPGTPLRVLALTATAGFRHDSIPVARQTLQTLASANGFTLTLTENLGDLNAATLASIDVIVFLLTSGELAFDATQKAAIVSFVERGGGFVGMHSATDTLYDWPDYGRIVGAYFKEHPWTQEATLIVEDRAHAATRNLGATLRLMEEYYTFRENPRPRVEVLLSLDAASVGASGDFPLSWSQTIGQGRSFYTALGHFESTWTDTRFRTHVAGAIRWAGRRE
jgi:type 1 glutamine amidotransferase